MTVHLFEHVALERLWKGLDELFLLAEVEVTTDLGWLFDVVHDTGFGLVWELGVLLDMIEGFQVRVLLCLVWTDFLDDCPHSVYVVGQKDAAHCLDEYHAKGLRWVSRSNVSKTNCKHNSSRPVIPPNIFLAPYFIIQISTDKPTVIFLDSSH